ncbi:MAG: guanine deaminase [Bacteroidales bacterium]|nr:guanine deaminase [Bacteroidales bacterium]
MKTTDLKLYKGNIFYFNENITLKDFSPDKEAPGRLYHYIENGLLAVENGKIKAVGDYDTCIKDFQDAQIIDYSGKMITPGFVDTHLHVTQSGIVAAYGEKLLEWLNNYVFPCEAAYHDDLAARIDINFFLKELIKNGTTTACGYGPLKYKATDILFEELSRRNMRFITGNTMQDRNSPKYLSLPAKENYEIAREIILKWHNKGRLSYAITPRFAFSSSEELLGLAGALKMEFPDLYIQSHIDENFAEIEGIKKLFPWSKNYLDVYDRFGLATDKTIFGHCLHLTEDEYEGMRDKKVIISCCPISNSFLGSGLFNFRKMMEFTDRITLGSDWGAGNTLSMLAVLDEFYKISMLQDFKVYSMTRWFLATLGAAKSLGLSDFIGSFKPGKEADFIIIDPKATELLSYRSARVKNIYELLFVLMTLGDSSLIEETYIYGQSMKGFE